MRRWMTIVLAAVTLTSGIAEAKFRHPNNCFNPPCPWEEKADPQERPGRRAMILSARDHNPQRDPHVERGWNEHRFWYCCRPELRERS